jgi:integrase
MPRRPNPVPTYRLHKQSGQVIVTVRDAGGRRRDILLGRQGTEQSKAEYRRILAELHAVGPTAAIPAGTTPDLTVNELLVAFMRWALSHYRDPAGEPTTEVDEIRRSLTPVKELYGHTAAREFGPKALAAVRQRMVAAGWCRSLINRRMDRVKRAFKWAVSEELVPVAVYHALRTVPGLRKGRSEARESEPVKPVDLQHVTVTLPFLNRHVRAMVELQRLTGMRPGEVCRLRLAEVDRSGDLWVYRPRAHKTAHRGKDRVIPLGPRARAIIAEFLRADCPPPEGFAHIDPDDADQQTVRLVMADAYQDAGRTRDAELLRDTSGPVALIGGCVVDPGANLFSPARERAERLVRWRRARKSKVPPSQRDRRKPDPKRVPAAEYHPHAYTNAIRKACEKAGLPHWHPNQLRHTFATEVRRAFGLEAAQVLLGHSRADVTQVYAERNLTLAGRVAAEIG